MAAAYMYDKQCKATVHFGEEMTMRMITGLKLAAAGLVALSAFGGSALAEEWRGWNIHKQGHPNTAALAQFAADVTEKTEGRVEVNVFNDGVLGTQPDAIEQVRNGALDFANFSMGPMGPIIPATNVLSLPFLFTGEDQMHKVMDGEIGRDFSDAMAEYGLISLAYFDAGSRSFYTTGKPIQTPADVEGMKIRVMNNDLYVNMIDQLGGNATPMAFAEVFQSLQTGVIDGAENNFPSYDSERHFEVAQFYSLTEHLIIPECICIAKSSWDALSAEDQEIVRQAAIDSSATQRRLWAEGTEKSRKLVEENGVTVTVVADKAPFQAAMQPVYDGFIAENPDLAAWIEKIQATN